MLQALAALGFIWLICIVAAIVIILFGVIVLVVMTIYWTKKVVKMSEIELEKYAKEQEYKSEEDKG